ncbi:rho GTPase-activating protein 15 isoform X2 [Lutzomyia longipalpis]|uniref:rho GTPase-activating protein 15 isoform X2 n=1 Tax=Lutzomyia longipalpis TaxID=7200 RepID=UPI0024837BE0|nr:rho GTPase-activating protein 15 isoform X2 [Lutzomyia longipalpis]
MWMFFIITHRKQTPSESSGQSIRNQHYRSNNDKYSKIEENSSDRSSRSHSNHSNQNKTLQRLQSQKSEFQRMSCDMLKAQEKLQNECALLHKENQELKNLLGERNAEIQELTLKLEELQNSKLSSKHSRFFSLRHNFQNIFQRRRTKDELVSKKILQNEPNFRTTLEKMEKDTDFRNVPRVLVEAVKVIEANFMNVIGLYRVSGNYAIVQDMRFHINSNDYEALRKQKDPHTITGIIKLLFRELEEPLISLKHLDFHIDDSNFLALSREYQIKQVLSLVETLPPVYRDTLQFLMKHLNKVIHFQGNQNNAHSLSVVVGACIFYELLSDVDFHMNLAKCTVSNKCIEIMIEDYSAIFEQV